jgi:hypothetical protein
MRTILLTALVMALLASSGPSLANSGPDESAQAKTNQSAEPGAAKSKGTTPAPIAQPIVPTEVVSDTDKDADMMICREMQAATGSRLGESRECHTKREWDKRRADIQRTIENAQQIGELFNPKGG